MALDLNPGAAPIVASKNYVNKDVAKYGGIITADENQVFAPRILDMDPYAYWFTSTISPADKTRTLIIEFYDGPGLTARTFNLFALLNTNIKNFQPFYSNDGGATYSTFPGDPGGGYVNAAADFVLALPSNVTGMRLKIVISDIQGTPPTDQYFLGTVVAAMSTLQMARPFEKQDVKRVEYPRVVDLGDKSQDVTYVKRSPASYDFFAASYLFTHVSEAEKEALRAIKRVGLPFLWMPEPAERPRNTFLARFDGAWSDDRYSDLNKGAGYDVGFNIREIGT